MGEGFFSFDIPVDTYLSMATISFIVRSDELAQIYSKVLVIGQPEQVVIDFIPETGILVQGVANKVYFHAFTNDARSDFVDFSRASLIGYNRDSGIETLLLDRSIKTDHRGKGVFTFTPYQLYDYYLEVNLGTRNGLIRKIINPALSLMVPNFNYEITFTIDNVNKVLSNNDDLKVTFITNNLVNLKDTYYINILNKEQILYSQ